MALQNFAKPLPIDLAAGIGAGPFLPPAVAPVPVGIRAAAGGARVLGPCLPPHPVVVPGVLIPVRVHRGHHVDVVAVQH